MYSSIVHGRIAVKLHETCCPWSHGLRLKKLKASVAMPPAPVLVPTPSVMSVTSFANDKGDNEMILGAVNKSPGIFLTAKENNRKPQLGDRLMKGLCDQSLPQMGPFPPNEVGRIA